MCQVNVPNVPKEVTDVVNEFVQQGKIFTAYDITTAARARTRQNVRHDDVRQYLTYFMNDPNNPTCLAYCVTVITLDVPGNPTPLCWYPQGLDPYAHPKAMKSVPVSQPDGSAPVAPASTVQGDPNAPFDEVVKITAEGRLNIPKSVLDQLAVANQVGGSVDVVFDGSVFPKKPNNDGRIRLGPPIVGQVSKNTFKVSVDTAKNCVVVEPV